MVFCDANVLYGSMLRNLLMWLGVQRTLSLRWSDQVQLEWTRNLLEHRPTLSAEALQKTCEQMNQAIPEALVEGWDENQTFDLPDPDDQHVLAAALAAEAAVLLTFNLSDFPKAAVPDGLVVVDPDTYLTVCLEVQPIRVRQALTKLRSHLKNPPLSRDEVLLRFEKAGLWQFASSLRRMDVGF
ncbi:PIN domain-containing protein [Deinococcus piscis]|uniref:PIN domain-containing protein n=1 Tax=Deinococcus piscis TaxID=394230 RepID=UPI0027E4C42A|nr:PIN domain-containing protein [Deinococcus piscis]